MFKFLVRMFQKLYKAGFGTHLIIALLIRIGLIFYGLYHDENYTVPYTDIDYKVFTDAARHVLSGNSPYNRHTYRYSPILAFLMVPNVLVHQLCGKLLFSLMDIVIAYIIRSIVLCNLNELEQFVGKSFFNVLCLPDGSNTLTHTDSNNKDSSVGVKYKKRSKQNINKRIKTSNISLPGSGSDVRKNIVNRCILFWLYNPMTIAISTRGNCDSVSGFLVLCTLYLLECRKKYFFTGVMHGISIHFRLYPIFYSLTMFMYLSKFSFYLTQNKKKLLHSPERKQIKDTENEILKNEVSVMPNERKTIFKREYLLYLLPNLNQIRLISGCMLSLIFLTSIFYYLYGYTFLYETYLFHVMRNDTRHNFSLYFYVQYLSAWVKNIGLWQKVLIILPQIVLLVVFSVRYGLNKFTLNFAVLLQTITIVIYNRVLTSQYFVWIMVLLPLCSWQLKLSRKTAVFLLTIWFAAQAAWLLPAYLLEFQGQNTFFFIWIQSVSFFCANIAILGRFIIHFMPELKKNSFKID